jgi:uncharacterized protein YndB with AHSA1/START domain
MSEYGEVVEQGSVRFQRLLPGPIERVWDYLTDSKLRASWFAGGTLEQRVGGAVHFTFRHSEIAPRGERFRPNTRTPGPPAQTAA